MALSRSSHARPRARFSALSLLAGTVTLGLLVACTPQGSVIPPPNRTPITYPLADPNGPQRPISTLGEEWTTFSYPEGTPAETLFNGFSAGGEFWIYEPRNQTVLYGTKDGETWRTVDATKYGVNNAGKVGAAWRLAPQAGGSVNSTFAVIYAADPELPRNTWILEIGPDTVALSDADSNGLNIMPPDENGAAYRSLYPIGMVEIEGSKAIIGLGYRSSSKTLENESFFTAFKGPAGVWSMKAPVSWPTGNDSLFPFQVTKVGDRVVVLTFDYKDEASPKAWSTADGLTWQVEELTGIPSELFRESIKSVSATEHGIAMWTNTGDRDDNQADIWTSVDGKTWNHTRLLNEGWQLPYVQVEEDGFTAFTIGYDSIDRDQITQILYSPDGISWTSAPGSIHNPTMLWSAISHESGFVYLGLDGIQVSGLPWGDP